MRGTDGRFYDRIFDLNGDGKLDAAEMRLRNEVLFEDDELDDVEMDLDDFGDCDSDY